MKYYLYAAASSAAGTATFAITKKLRPFEHAIRKNLSLADMAPMPDLNFGFIPLAVDTLRRLSEQEVASVKYYVRQASMLSASVASTVATQVWQKLSLAV